MKLRPTRSLPLPSPAPVTSFDSSAAACSDAAGRQHEDPRRHAKPVAGKRGHLDMGDAAGIGAGRQLQHIGVGEAAHRSRFADRLAVGSAEPGGRAELIDAGISFSGSNGSSRARRCWSRSHHERASKSSPGQLAQSISAAIVSRRARRPVSASHRGRPTGAARGRWDRAAGTAAPALVLPPK